MVWASGRQSLLWIEIVSLTRSAQLPELVMISLFLNEAWRYTISVRLLNN
jgi:hypothetical protein